MKQVSAQQDSILAGGQGNSLALQHAMRGPDQSVEEAKQLYNDFVANNEEIATRTQVDFWLAGNSGYSDKALASFAAALHAVTDSTSPAHEGFQVWNWRDVKLILRHRKAESSITQQQLQTAIATARAAFRTTFGQRSLSWLAPGLCWQTTVTWTETVKRLEGVHSHIAIDNKTPKQAFTGSGIPSGVGELTCGMG